MGAGSLYGFGEPLDELDIAVMLRDANMSLRKLFPDYETKVEPVRQIIRSVMERDNKDVLPALIVCLEASVEKGTIDNHGIWFMAAVTDLLGEKHAETVAQKVLHLVEGLDLGKKKKRSKKVGELIRVDAL